MKYLLIIIVNIAFCNYLFATKCDLPQGCADEQFPYIFCNSNNLVPLCSSNPYNMYDGTTHLKPMKMNCIVYDQTDQNTFSVVTKKTNQHDGVVHHENGVYDEDITIYYPDSDIERTTDADGNDLYDGEYLDFKYDTHDGDRFTDDPCNKIFTDFYGFTAFDIDDVSTDVTNALNIWRSFCVGCDLNNQSMQDNNCCAHIRWSSDATKFNVHGLTAKDVYAKVHTSMRPGAEYPCGYDCNDLFIYINQTNAFTGATLNDPCNYSNFFITGSTTKGNWASLTNVLMHEMGHIFGFSDQFLWDDQQNSALSGCFHTGSIMDGTDQEDPNRSISNDDRCMYMKMYCWTPPTGINDSNPLDDVSINMFPNPTNTDKITISVNSDKINCILSYRIYSFDGIEVTNGYFNAIANKQKTIDLKGISSGSYIIMLNCQDKLFMQKFEKIK